MRYIDTINKDIKAYYEILSKDYPNWLDDYINTKEIQKLKSISVTCGTIYTNLFDINYFYSTLDHSVAVALIIWNFTHDKKQTLSGLFHDIATPVFKHSIDFLNGDYMTQESTEEKTTEIIRNSKEIMRLLKRDNIKVEEINDYHIYPIADNDTPKLSSDRLEYSLSNALFVYNIRDKEQIKEIYNDIEIQTNEEGEIELGFQTKKYARDFVRITSKLSKIYREEKTVYSMQFIADILKKLKEENLLTIDDLYNLEEQEIIKLIESSKYNKIFKIWRNAKRIKISKEKPDNVYSVKIISKIRYVDPLLNGKRISKECKLSKKMIDNNLAYKADNYVYLKLNM